MTTTTTTTLRRPVNLSECVRVKMERGGFSGTDSEMKKEDLSAQMMFGTCVEFLLKLSDLWIGLGTIHFFLTSLRLRGHPCSLPKSNSQSRRVKSRPKSCVTDLCFLLYLNGCLKFSQGNGTSQKPAVLTCCV